MILESEFEVKLGRAPLYDVARLFRLSGTCRISKSFITCI